MTREDEVRLALLHGGGTPVEITKRTGIPERIVRAALHRLVRSGDASPSTHELTERGRKVIAAGAGGAGELAPDEAGSWGGLAVLFVVLIIVLALVASAARSRP
jgi:DNA-binding transcriptional regulator PaaX